MGGRARRTAILCVCVLFFFFVCELRFACIDSMEALFPRAASEAFTVDGHYSELGNRLVAARVGETLAGRGGIAGPRQGIGMP